MGESCDIDQALAVGLGNLRVRAVNLNVLRAAEEDVYKRQTQRKTKETGRLRG